MTLYDITPPITPSLRVWPGDTPPTREVLLDMRRGDEITLSTLRTTVHLGAHADAPSHYGADAPPIDRRSLDYYLGPCQLIRLPVELFPEDFAALSPQLVTWLHERGVRLVGIDTPSVDPFPSKELPAHETFLRHDMAILEGLMLKDVPEGICELIALPLRLVGFDASPVRAVLRALP